MIEKKLEDWWKLKKEISSSKEKNLFLKKKNIRWVSIWENIWFEENWKWEDFSRPVLVFKILNLNSFIWIPLTSQFHEWTFFCKISFLDFKKNRNIKSFALLNQVRIFSNKRIIWYWWRINNEEFWKIKKKLWKLLWFYSSEEASLD